jgi:hypothetical protein
MLKLATLTLRLKRSGQRFRLYYSRGFPVCSHAAAGSDVVFIGCRLRGVTSGLGAQDSGTRGKRSCRTGRGLDLVAQGEAGAGIGASGLVELFAHGGQRLGAPQGGERVEPAACHA